MQKFSCKLFLLIILLVFGFAMTAQAVPYMLPENTPIMFQFNNLEQVDLSFTNSITVPGGFGAANGTDGNWGLINISSIQSGSTVPIHEDVNGGPVIWFDDGVTDTFGMGQITGIFYDLILTSSTTAIGGKLELYWHDAADDFVTSDFLNGTTASPDLATVIAFTSGIHLVTLEFATGEMAGSNATVESTVPISDLQGQSNSYANVDLAAGGVWADLLNGDWFWTDADGDGTFGEVGETRDLRLRTNYSPLTSWDDPINTSIKGLDSTDPGRVFTATTIPEPGTIFLLGAGLLGFAGVMRRK